MPRLLCVCLLAASVVLRAAETGIMRAANNGTIHKKAASRKIARLTARVKKLAVA